MRLGKCNVVRVWIALLIGATFTFPAWAAGSDVVHYPRAEISKDTTIREHGDIGVPAPRTRAFAHARWADDTTRPHF